MINFTKTLITIAAGLSAVSLAMAQEEEFDLSLQRSESQYILPVPGEKVDHGGLIINPTPRKLTLKSGASLDISKGVILNDIKGKFAADLDFIGTGSGAVTLTIDYGKKAMRNGVRDAAGAYVLEIASNGISIYAKDEQAAFYGIQTLRQIVESPISEGGKLPQLIISDWPDLGYRGVVEGFYGEPWSHEVRLSLIDFYGRNKMNCYIYGPKDDPYHSTPSWRFPYPEQQARQIRELVAACRKNRMDFVWAIHPGKDIQWNEKDYKLLLGKFILMHSLGVRSFALFFDDISGEGTNPHKQVELINRLNKDFIKKKKGVKPLIFCPTDYSKLWANPTPQGSLSIFGDTMDKSVDIFWTGDVVCSDLTKETMEWVNSRIKRPGFYWWNYPVTDYARHILMQGPVYGLSGEVTSEDLCGLVSNPMEHGEASKLALYGVADYTWNVKAYNPIDNWERGIEELAPEVKDAYRTFAIHSCDTETGYRRSESWETETFTLDGCTDEKYDALMAEFRRIEAVPEAMKYCNNKLLLSELKPWLTEFGKLGERGRRTLECIRLYQAGDYAGFWQAYVDNLMSDEEKAAYNAHKSGTLKLQPFYENMMDELAVALYRDMSGKVPNVPKAIGTYPTLSTTQYKLMFDRDETTFFNSGDAQKEGHWIGVDLGSVRPVSEVKILQGKNSVDDNDYFDHAVVECSADGKMWKPLTDNLVRQYEIHWKGEPVEARYVRMRKFASEKTSWTVIRSFEVNPQPESFFDKDGNPFTSVNCKGGQAYDLPAGTKSCCLLMHDVRAEKPAVFRQLAADGSLIAEAILRGPYFEMEIKEGAVKVDVLGDVELFETIFISL